MKVKCGGYPQSDVRVDRIICGVTLMNLMVDKTNNVDSRIESSKSRDLIG